MIVDLWLIHTSLSPHLIRDLICGFAKLKVQPDWLVLWEGPDIGIGIQKVGAAACCRSLDMEADTARHLDGGS